MSNTLSKILTIFLGVLFAISVIFVVLFYIKVAPLDKVDQLQSSFVGYYLGWAALLLALTAVLAIVFPIISMVTNPKGAIKSLISIVVIVIVIAITYSFSSGELLQLSANYQGSDNVPGTLKLADTGLFTTYAFFGLAILAAIVSEVMKIFR